MRGSLVLVGLLSILSGGWIYSPAEQIDLFHGSVLSLEFSADGNTLLASGSDGYAFLLDANTLSIRKSWRARILNDSVYSSLRPDGREAAFTSSLDTEVIRWDFGADQALGRLPHESSPTAVSYSPDGRTLLTGTADGNASLWDLATSEKLFEMNVEAGPISTVSFDRTGRFALISARNGRVLAVESTTGKQVVDIHLDVPVHSGEYHPSGKTIAIGTEAGVRIVDAASGEKLWKYNTHTANECSVAHSPDGEHLIFTEEYSFPKVLDLKGSNLHTVLRAERFFTPRRTLFNPQGTAIYGGARDGNIRIWRKAGAPAEVTP